MGGTYQRSWTRHVRTNRIDSEHAAEAERLSRQVVRISGILVDQGMLPIQNIFLGERRCIAPVRPFVKLHTLGDSR
jgi:hypothetical protein